MSNKSKNINDIVSQTARALGSGKSFGGWTDKVEEDTNRRNVKKQHASMEREKEEKDEEPLVIHGPDGTRKNPQYSKFIYPKDVRKQQKYKIVHNYDKDGTMSTQYVKDEVEESVEVHEGIGSFIGGALGSVVPGVGTAIGAAVGGAAEGIGKSVFKKSKKPGEPSKA
jgi:hypothetical protein